MATNQRNTDPITVPGNVMQTSTLDNVIGNITCVCNSENFERVQVTYGENSAVFNGNGVGELMNLDNGETFCQFKAIPNAIKIIAEFTYANEQNGTPQKAAQVTESFITQDDFVIINLDSASNSDAGATLSITFSSVVSTSRAVEEKTNEVTEFAPDRHQLELHAKTYYNDPNIQGGDEHYVTIPSFTGDVGSLEYASTGFSYIDGGVYNQMTPLGGYLHISIKAYPRHPSLNTSAILTLSTVYSYWLMFPTGYGSTSWQAVLEGSPYKIIRITN